MVYMFSAISNTCRLIGTGLIPVLLVLGGLGHAGAAVLPVTVMDGRRGLANG